MPGIVRFNDVCSGHDCFPPRRPTSCSPDVFINGIAVERNGDTLETHCCDSSCHGGIYVGSGSVYANGRSIQVVADPISCGSICAVGSGDTFAK